MWEPTAEIPGLEFIPSMVNVKGQSVPCVVRNIAINPISIPKRLDSGQLEAGVAERPPAPKIRDREWMKNLDLTDSDISPEQKEQVKLLLLIYEHMLDGRLGFPTVVEHKIDTSGSPPMRSAARRIPQFMADKVKAELQKMVDLGMLEESNGYWGSPICVVAKRDENVRICEDLRRVNAVTKLPAYQIPGIDSVLDSLAGNNLFCVLDLKQCYYQIGLTSEEDMDKTTIVTPLGSFRHSRVPMGLSGAPSSCARLLDILLRDLPPRTADKYFDDVICAGQNFEQVYQKLEMVLSRLSQAGLAVNLGKCMLFRKSVKFLGHIISEEGLAFDPERESGQFHDLLNSCLPS